MMGNTGCFVGMGSLIGIGGRLAGCEAGVRAQVREKRRKREYLAVPQTYQVRQSVVLKTNLLFSIYYIEYFMSG